MGERVVRAAAVAALTVTALSGCMFVTPQQTARSYTPSDGINSRVGDVQIRNVFLVTGDGTSANLIGALTNTAASERTVTMQYRTTSGLRTARVVVPGDGLLSLRPATTVQSGGPAAEAGQQVTLEDIRAPKGGSFPIGFTSGGDPVSLQLPVLTNSLPDYRTLTPAPSVEASTPVPSDEPTPLPTDTPPDDGRTLSPEQPPGP